MSEIIRTLDDKFYPGCEKNWDDQLFRKKILSHISADCIVLDLGAGAGIVQAMNFRGKAGRICGIDLDQRVEINTMLDEGKIANAGEIPYPDDTFDVVFSDNVMEHISDPLTVFKEVYRVMKTGGVFLFKTPNKIHYMPTIARITPHKFHQFVNRLRGRDEEDTFPTLYRVNTPKSVHKFAQEVGLSVVALERIEGRPEYLRFSWPTYLLGIIYERIVNSTNYFSIFRILLIAELQKK